MEAINASALDQKLDARGLLRVGGLWGWHAVKHNNITGWEYPIYNPFNGEVIGTRFKSAETGGKFKYGWLPSKPSNPLAEWYTMPTAIEAIREAGGVVYVANGEPALLAYHAAQVYNVIATTLSEIAVPKNIKSYLKDLGVTRLLYPVDNDAAGLKSAVNWRDALRGSGIDYEAFAWGKEAPAKADANDIWIQVGFDAEAFQARLQALESLVLPEPEPIAPKAASVQVDFSGIQAKLLEQVHSAISSQGRFTGKRYGGGQWLQMTCLFHDDHEASAGLNVTSGVVHCFTCGAKASITKVAEALNIQWRDLLPKTEKKAARPKVSEAPVKTAKKPDFSDFEKALAQLGAANPDTRDLEQVIADDLMAREIAFDDKQFMSWFATEQIPTGVLSALLHLSKGRSNLAVVFGLIHKALREGRLRSFFTLDEACQVLDMPRKSVHNALFELSQFNFVSKLRTLSSYIKDTNTKKLPKETTQNSKVGRPSDIYLIELSESEWRKRLREELEIYWREKLITRAISKRSADMALGLGLDDEQHRAWQARGEIAAKEKLSKEANKAFELEFMGNGKSWRGWEAALKSNFALTLDWKSLKDVRSLRVALLGQWITHVRDVNSRDELRRLLGCSDPMIDEVMHAGNILTTKQYEKFEFSAPKSVPAMKSLFNKTQRENSGKVFQLSFKVNDEWCASGEKTYLKDYTFYAGRIESVFMLLSTPSRQRPMTEAEILERDEKLAEEAALRETERQLAGETLTTGKTDDSEKEAKESGPRLIARFHDRHSYRWLYNQIRLEVHCFTPHALVGHQVIDSQGQALVTGDLPKIVQWLDGNAAPKMLRTVADFYGKNYDEEADVKALDLIAQAQIAALEALHEKEAAELNLVEDLPIMLELPFNKPSVTILKKPQVVTTNPQKGVVDYPLDPHSGEEYHDYLNNPYITEWERENRKRKVNEWRKESLAAAMNAA